MKKFLSLILCLCICMSFSACKADDKSSEHIKEYESEYDFGYDTAYENGFWDGVFECKEEYADAVKDQFFKLESETSREWDLHPEEAIMVLNDYLDGEYVSDDELETAIKSISDFYYDLQRGVVEIDDIYVDIDFE